MFAALEKAGLEVARMEGYTAADERPVDNCLHDVAASDLYIGIYAWRYGYEPPAHHGNPQSRSITELEYRKAERRRLRRLVFLAHPDTKAQWPSYFVDEVTGSGSGGEKLNAFRAEVGAELTASLFRTPDELATLVLAAIMRTGLTGRPYNVPPQRPGVVPRPALIEAVRHELVESGGPGRSTLVWGPGGFGKTTLALSACHAPEVVKAFPDGMLWVTLGEHADLPTVLTDLHVAIAGERPAASGTTAIAEMVAKTLARRQCLLVIDDVWRSDDLAPFFMFDGPRLLVTSRVQNLLAESIATGWAEIPVDQMEDEEAAALLARGLSLDAPSRAAIADLADKLGFWPLLLGLANARLLEEHKSRRNVAECIAHVAAVYKAKGVLGFDRHDSNARNAAVGNSVEVGLTHAESMSAGLATRAAELAIFPEDAAVSVRVLADLWGLDELHTEEDAVRPLDNVCLVQWDRERGQVRLHDMIRRALAANLANAPAVHGRLVDAWGDSHRLPHEYAWRRMAYHLEHGQRHAQLRALLRDFAWLRAKLQATDIVALVADFEALPSDDPMRLIQDALRLASSYLAADKGQLASQLIGRLRPGVDADIDALLAQTTAWRGEAWLRPLQPTLHGAGGPLMRVFRGYAGGHRGTVRSIAMDAGGRWAVSAGNSLPDQCIIVWNLATGAHYKLEGQAEAGGWTPLAMTGKGDRFVSAHPGEVRAWRIAEMAPFATCRVPSAHVGVVDIEDDGMRVIIGGPDGEIAIWSPSTGRTSALGRHEPTVEDIAITPDGMWAVSISTVDARLWDLDAGREAQCWPTTDFSRTQWGRGVAIAHDGHRVAWTCGAPGSADGGIWQWDSTGRSPLVAGSPAAGGISAFCFERGRAIVRHPGASGRSAMTFALLVFSDKPRIIELTDIGRGISCAAVSCDGRWAITADYEHDLMLWDLDRAEAAPASRFATLPPWHNLPFRCFAENGRYALFGVDNLAPLVWEVAANAPLTDAALAYSLLGAARKQSQEAEAHRDVLEARRPPARKRGRVVLAPWKKFVGKRAVNAEEMLRGHLAPILGRDIAPNGRWEATASEDGTVRVWDLIANRQLALFSDETIFSRCVWAEDSLTLATTDYQDKTHLLRLEGVEP